jgi:RNA polymerase sigma factor (sigma-70 family)
MDGLSDEEIVVQYRKTGDRQLVGELFRRYTRFVFLVCMKYLEDEDEAKDAAMQVFENLFAGLKKHDIRSFRPWLHTVTKNHCLYQIRSARQMQISANEMKKDASSNMETSDVLHLEDVEEKRLKHLEEAILLLSREQQLCIELFYLKKLRYQEIVERTGQTYEQVKSHIQNGKRNLRILISKRNER